MEKDIFLVLMDYIWGIKMTERYKIEYHEDLLEISSIIDTEENHELTAEEIVDLLNENEHLKQKIRSILNEDIGYVESFKKIEEVLK